ncbi:MAG: hypothetical protein IKK97_04335 [Phascolarctobacterium sp.]|nr:hypothetical protein [Phascolarctobacterium sp.]
MKVKLRRYIECTVPEFRENFKALWNDLPLYAQTELLSKPEYLVRINPDLGAVEFGFASDSWQIN